MRWMQMAEVFVGSQKSKALRALQSDEQMPIPWQKPAPLAATLSKKLLSELAMRRGEGKQKGSKSCRPSETNGPSKLQPSIQVPRTRRVTRGKNVTFCWTLGRATRWFS